ncbi:unnamed protein product, partial [Brassica rapa subsp. narinosa]
SVVSLCSFGAPAPVLQALARRWVWKCAASLERTLDGVMAGAGTPNRLRLSKHLIPPGSHSLLNFPLISNLFCRFQH